MANTLSFFTGGFQGSMGRRVGGSEGLGCDKATELKGNINTRKYKAEL